MKTRTAYNSVKFYSTSIFEFFYTLIRFISLRILLRLLCRSQFLVPFRSYVEFMPRLTMLEEITPSWVLCVTVSNWTFVRKITGVQTDMHRQVVL